MQDPTQPALINRNYTYFSQNDSSQSYEEQIFRTYNIIR